MKTFADHLLDKRIDYLAEKCERENIPIVEFVQWYEEEGQFLKEEDDENLQSQPSWLGSVGRHMATGATAGGLFGGVGGALGGAGVGLATGTGKWLWDKVQAYRQNTNFQTSKQQAIQALQRLIKIAPRLDTKLYSIINALAKIEKDAVVGGGKVPNTGGAETMSTFMGSGDPHLDKILEKYGVPPHVLRGKTKADYDAALSKAQEAGIPGKTGEAEEILAALKELGAINPNTKKPYEKFDPTTRKFEHRTNYR